MPPRPEHAPVRPEEIDERAAAPYHPRRIITLLRELHLELLGNPRELDWRPFVVLIVTAVSLSIQEYVGSRGVFFKTFHATPALKQHWELLSFTWWTGWRVVGYLLFPMLVVALMPGERLRDYGWSTAGFLKHLKLYAFLFLIILPLVWFMSTTKPFQRIYPFYRVAGRSAFDFFAWEAMYALQFLSLEFFFRGFMLNGTKRSLGVHSIWVMTVPYCMIHFGKTLSETLGAIIAGLVLGTVALRTKSIWGGVLIHVAVAVTMDALCVRYCAGAACPR